MKNGRRGSQSDPAAGQPAGRSTLRSEPGAPDAERRQAPSRRQALQGLGVGLSMGALGGVLGGALASSGCGGGQADSGNGSGPGTNPDAPPPPSGRQLLAGIDSIVVLMMENRSFDHYLGALRGDAAYRARADVDGLRGGESNPDPMSGNKPVPVFLTQNRTPKDPPHGWDACHSQWNGGRNDGFVAQYIGAGAGSERAEVMGYHDRSELPFFYSLADRFTICDRWFASVMGPTWPNRFYLHAGSSFGKKDNTPLLDAKLVTVWDRLRARGLAGKNYSASLVAFYSGGFLGKSLAGQSPVAPMDAFFADARAGKLPPFSIIDPDFLANDDHPSHDINLGQAFMAGVVQAVAQGPGWARTLLVITYDEHGGFFDHVSPPAAADDQADFRQLGFRVPAILIGGTVRQGTVVHTPFEHTSVAATLRTRFGIDSLGARMDAAADLSSCIDPDRLTSPLPPPTDLPKVTVRLRQALGSVAATETSQPELSALAARGLVPTAHLDRRPTPERLHAFLTQAAALGAVNLLD